MVHQSCRLTPSVSQFPFTAWWTETMYIKFYVEGHNITTSSDHNGALTSNLWVTDLTPMTPESCAPSYSIVLIIFIWKTDNTWSDSNKNLKCIVHMTHRYQIICKWTPVFCLSWSFKPLKFLDLLSYRPGDFLKFKTINI